MEIKLELNTTNALLLINILLFLVTSYLTVILNGSDTQTEALLLLGADNYSKILDGEIWRFVTSSFLHANVYHLLFNMYSLYYLGNFAEKLHGGRKIFIVYIIAGVVGSLLSFLNNWFFIELMGVNADPISVGASGALFGFLGFILVVPDFRIDKSRIVMILLLNVFLGFAIARIDQAAHIGGLLAGMMLGLLEKGTVLYKFENIFFAISLLLFILGYLGLVMFNIF